MWTPNKCTTVRVIGEKGEAIGDFGGVSGGGGSRPGVDVDPQ